MSSSDRLARAETNEAGTALEILFDIDSPVLFSLDFRIALAGADDAAHELVRSRDSGLDIPWLPRGRYRLRCSNLAMPGGEYHGMRVGMWADCDHADRSIDQLRETWPEPRNSPGRGGGARAPAWQLECPGGEVDIASLSWSKGHEDWFFRHFDHSASVILGLLLKYTPLLGGRILDVGCGDGITDLSVFYRCRPELLVGIDPFRGFDGLEKISRDNQLPTDWANDDRLRFEPHDGNDIPYEDDSFDVVLSWGAMEHIAGGYGGVLDEIRRVLRDGGLFFCMTGLYFGPTGNHLGEFFEDPWIHLKLDDGELHGELQSRAPRYMDRAGVFASAEDYWQWYKELNHVTVDGFESDLRRRGFEPWRVALRHCDVVEYTPELQKHSFADLVTSELYVSAWNRKGGPA